MADVTRIVSVANQKGGVGKTTTTVNVAASLAQSGFQVLVIDLDPQGNASTALGIDHHEGVHGVYEVLGGEVSLADVVKACPDVPGLWGAPATIDLAGAEIELVSQVAREYRLSRAVEKYVQDFERAEGKPLDFILMDCPPSLGLLTLNGLVAARELRLPIQCESYALEGLSQLLRTVDMVQTHLNPELEVSAILLTMYDGRTRLASQVVDEVRTHFGTRVLQTVIPRAVRVSEAPSFAQTIMTYDASSPGALTYREAAEEFAAIVPKGANSPS